MSYPLALIDNEGNILWANKRLKEELNLLDLQEQNILSIGRNLDLQKLLKCDKDYLFLPYSNQSKRFNVDINVNSNEDLQIKEIMVNVDFVD